MTAEEMSQRLEISRASYYRFENGEIVKISTFEALAELFSTSIVELLRLEETAEQADG